MTDSTGSPIVVGIDGSESATAALRYARTLAEALHRPVRLLFAWHLPAFAGGGPLAYDWDPVEEGQRVLDDAVIDVYGSTPPPNLTTQVVESSPAAALVTASADASMIVVGSRGHGGFLGLLLGSVSSAVAEHADCPVLVVH